MFLLVSGDDSSDEFSFLEVLGSGARGNNYAPDPCAPPDLASTSFTSQQEETLVARCEGSGQVSLLPGCETEEETMSWLTRSIHDEPRRELPMLRLVIGSEAHLEGCSCEHSSCLPFLTRVLVKEKEGKTPVANIFFLLVCWQQRCLPTRLVPFFSLFSKGMEKSEKKVEQPGGRSMERSLRELYFFCLETCSMRTFPA